ncbi:MAG TPA: sodium:solute symporter [Opitutus sp.]|nr:sodium:solute symporter [Opitutus sp.]
MSWIDYAVLLATMLSIGVYGVWRSRSPRDFAEYLHGNRATGWGTIGLGVMATQASAVTFLSTPGQAYENGLAFVQNYFGLPLALIIVAAVFLPIYRRLKVHTAYEYLGHRFDRKTRLLGAALFLLQRGLASGITIYAPAIILSTVLGWSQDVTIVAIGVFVVAYTAIGGNEAVSVTQKWQMAVILGGLLVAFLVVLQRLPVGLGEALTIAGGFGKLQAVDFSFDPDRRYTLWTGLLGGLFLSLSYFGTDQSQVGRYLAGSSLRESRLGLMFNAVFKIPMQFFVLLLGALVFVFYQFQSPPVFFNTATWQAHAQGADGARFQTIERDFARVAEQKRPQLEAWLAAERNGDAAGAAAAKSAVLATHRETEQVRHEARQALAASDPTAPTNDADYVFIRFVLDHMPHGVIGLLMALILCAAVSSLSSELVALGSTTAVDFYRAAFRPGETDRHYVSASKWLTTLWGAIAIAFALFANLVENLIQAINILGSIFYGVVLGLFLVAFFLKRIGGTAAFWGAAAAQTLVFVLYASLSISYLWYNVIGCAACVFFAFALQAVLPGKRS